jgi:hypothetical protein
MTKRPSDTRNRILLLGLGTLLVLAVTRVTLISSYEDQIRKTTIKVRAMRDQLRQVDVQIAAARKDQTLGEGAIQVFTQLESQMASGDLYRWVINELAPSQSKFNVAITSFSPPQLSDADLPPKLPFPQATYSLAGTAYYQDFGNFLAAFENRSAFVRPRSLTLEAANAGTIEGDASEKLGFHFDFSILVQTNLPAASAKP